MSEFIPMTGFTKLLLSALVAAFLAWAGVVWRASENLSERLTRIEEKLDHVRTNVSEHEAQPWHSRAGEAIIQLQTLMLRDSNDPYEDRLNP